MTHFSSGIGILTSIIMFTVFMPQAFAEQPLTRSFGLGATDAKTNGDVTRLQKILASDKTVYPEGVVSGYYGKLTELAVQRWQKKYKLISGGTPGTTGFGWVGPKTRESLNMKNVVVGKPAVTPATKPTAAVQPVVTGALTIRASGDLAVPSDLIKTAIYTNTLTGSFLGAGNGQKVTFTQSVSQKGITVPKTLFCTTPCSLENKVSIAKGTPAGTYLVTVMGVAGKEGGVGYYNVTIGDSQPFTFTLEVSKNISMEKKTSGTVSGKNEITVRTLTGVPQVVNLTQKTNIQGLVVKDLGSCTPPCSKFNTVIAGLDLATGAHNVTITGTAGDASRSANYIVSLGYNSTFGFHISNQEDTDKSITVTRPAAQSVTNYVPLKFILDGGTPVVARVVFSKFPVGLSATVNGCLLPCDATLVVSVSPDVKVGSQNIAFSLEADYIDKAGLPKTMKKTYSQSIKVINGDQLGL